LPVLQTTTPDHIVFGTDFPPGGSEVIHANMDELATTTDLDDAQVRALGDTALDLFPRLRERIAPSAVR
jgi:predicted TIM-barrel fold metal-dependent hydrolase